MTKAAGGLIDLADLPSVGVPLDIVANTGGGYTAGLATAVLFIGGTHVALAGTIVRTAGLQRAVTIGTIPAGLRPSQSRRLVCAIGTASPGVSESGTTAINIATDGTIILTANAGVLSPNTTVFLDAIMFPI